MRIEAANRFDDRSGGLIRLRQYDADPLGAFDQFDDAGRPADRFDDAIHVFGRIGDRSHR